MNNLQGAMTALITPFKDGKIDKQTYETLIKRQIKNNIDVVVPVGTTGESTTLSHDEHKECIEIAVSVCKGTNTRVMAGAGSNCTQEAIELAQFAQKVGADAILSVTPYYNKPTQEGLYQHYKTIANSIDIPVMLYNVPGRTGVDLVANTVFRLIDDVANIYGIKEATGSMERSVELLAKRDNLVVVSGDDAINYNIIANGGHGCISVTSNILPNMVSTMVHTCLNKDYDSAKKIHNELFDINKILFCESNPIPIKYAMYVAGLIPTLEYRLPLTPPSSENMKKIENILSKYNIIK